MEDILNMELAPEARAAARAKARVEAREKKRLLETVQRLLEMGLTPDQIANALDVPIDYV